MRRFVIALISGALIASGLVGLGVMEAPPASAAPSAAPINTACGPDDDQGVVNREDGVSGSLACTYVRGGNGLFIAPSGITSYKIWYYGGGGGGGAATNNTNPSSGFIRCGNYGSNSTSYSQTWPVSTYPMVGWTGGAGGAGGSTTGSTTGSTGSSTEIRAYNSVSSPNYASYFASGGNGGTGDAGQACPPYSPYTPARGEWPSLGTGGWGAQQGAGAPAAPGFDGVDGGAAITFSPALPGTASAVVATNTPGVTGSVNVSWTAPASGSSNGDWNYQSEVIGTATGGATGSCIATRSPANSATAPNSCTITGLTPGKSYTFTVKTYNVLGNGTNTASAPSAAVIVPDPPVNTAVPTVSGTGGKFAIGVPLNATDGTWSGATPTYGYQWQACTSASNAGTCSNISGATGSTYTPVPADAEKYLRVGVTATNSYASVTAYSALNANQQIAAMPAFTAASPPLIADAGSPGVVAAYTFAASGGRVTFAEDRTSPLTGLPAGMSISSSGVLTGAPQAGTENVNGGVYTYKVVATNDAGSTSTSTLTLTVSSGIPGSLTITTQPVGGARSGAPLTTQPVLALKDSSSRLIARQTPVVATVSAGGTLGGTTSMNTSNGVVTYTDLTLAGLVQTNYTLTFTSGSVTAVSNPLQVTPGDVATIEILTQPVAAPAAGDLMVTQPVVRLKDAQGNVVDNRSESVTVSSVLDSAGTPAGGAVTGSQAAGLATTTGTANFTNLAFGGTIGTNYKLKFTNGAVTALSQNVASTQAGPAAKLSIQTQPGLNGTQLVGSAFTTQPVIRILDSGDNPTTSTAAVTATSSGGTLGGTTEVVGSSGTVTFTDLTFAGLIGTNYTLTFTSPELSSATSNTFQFANASQKGPVSTATSTISSSDAGLAADGADTATITVQMKDAGGNNLTTSQGVIALSASVGTLGVVTDNNNGTYTATYTAPSSRGSGETVISGTLNSNAITDTATIALYTTQTITFPQPVSVVLGTLPYALDASASSGLTVTYASTTGAVCTVTSGGIVTILTTGNCQINADQTGDSIYWPAPQVSRTFAISATTPTAPFITSIVEGNTQATVHFTAPGFTGGSAITDYEYSLNGGTTWVSGASATSPITLTGLTNGTAYQVSLRAVNAVGAGLASARSSEFTPVATGGSTVSIPTTTPSAPRNPQVTADPGTTATVAWQEPRSNGGVAITSYTVTVSPSGTCTASIAATSRVGSCTISGLTPGTTYTFTIVAVNANGAGEAASVAYTVPGGGGGGGGGGGNGDNGTGGGTSGGNSGGNGGGAGGGGGNGDDGTGGTRSPFPPEIPTPDGPTDEETGEVLKKPSTVSVSGLPKLPIVQGTGPMPGGTTGTGSGLRSGMDGVKVLPTASAELTAALAAGAKVTMASGSAQVGYMTSRKITIAPKTMLQIVSSLEPDDQRMALRLWMQDRSGEWFRMGRTSTVNGQVVFPVMQFDMPGTYQVIATSVSGSRAVDDDGNPVFGSTTVRTIVIVTPRQALGTDVCPNMVSFDPRSAMLSKDTKRQIRRLAECLGAMPAIKVSGYVAQAVRPEAAERMAFLRARNVRNYLRELGYDGGAKVRTSIELRPAACEETNNRCALVRLDLGTERPSERAAWQLVAAAEVESAAPGAVDVSPSGNSPNVEGEQLDLQTSGAPPGEAAQESPPIAS